ncbi:sulfotransferase [Salinibacter grassmerensis]|uniref:sulfotransferase n=1 Tax=Salinibacter grassmerensis TaxID=3040353 RepID=UPI0021E7D347|nr:sulfotransferase [Salinibacter grassmerensis]
MSHGLADHRCTFVVGSSRSGTTMMGRILGRHPAVYTFHELHFFEQMWSPGAGTFTDRTEAVEVATSLLHL